MIINNGPIGSKFNPEKDLLIGLTDNSLELITTAGVENLYDYSIINNKWELKIYQSCKIKFNKKVKIDFCLVGGGGGGKIAGTGSGGKGGEGGKVLNIFKYLINDKNIQELTVGIGGKGQYFLTNDQQDSEDGTDTKAFFNIAEGGTAGGGGTGAFSDVDHCYPGGNTNDGTVAATSGNPGTYPFNEGLYLYKYGADGGGGGCFNMVSETNWNYNGRCADGAEGAETGGGKGCDENDLADNSTNGQTYGAGGGGGAPNWDSFNKRFTSSSGNGYQGIIIIRNS